MSQPRSNVSAARGTDRHRFVEPGSFFGILIWRHPLGKMSGVEPSGLQHCNVPPLPLKIIDNIKTHFDFWNT